MDDYCIENDFPPQREMAEMAIHGLQDDWRRMKSELEKCQEEFEEYKNATEWDMGSDWVDKILKQYRLNTKL